MISTLTVLTIIGSLIFAIVFPIVTAMVIRKKYKASLVSFFVGCATFFVFAIVLEQIMHMLILTSPIGSLIQNNIWLYGIYGGLAAGLFEEVGRYLAMRFVLQKHYENPYNAIMYGAGHGGLEVLLVLGISMINNLLIIILYSSGPRGALLGILPMEQSDIIGEAFRTIAETPTYLFLAGDTERISSMILHISFSVLVWCTVVTRKKWLLIFAILIHAAIDAMVAIINGHGIPTLVIELIVFLMAVAVALFARIFWMHDLRKKK